MKTLKGKHQVIRNAVPAEGKARKKRRTNHNYKEVENEMHSYWKNKLLGSFNEERRMGVA